MLVYSHGIFIFATYFAIIRAAWWDGYKYVNNYMGYRKNFQTTQKITISSVCMDAISIFILTVFLKWFYVQWFYAHLLSKIISYQVVYHLSAKTLSFYCLLWRCFWFTKSLEKVHSLSPIRITVAIFNDVISN